MGLDYGYHESRPDARGVVRIRTDVQVRLSLVPREAVRKGLQEEFGTLQFPGLYILLDEQTRRAYIGETAHLTDRLGQHLRQGPKELRTWGLAVLVGDGRPSLHSILTDGSVREYLERSLMEPLRLGGYEVTNKVARPPQLNLPQKATADAFGDELVYALARRGLGLRPGPAPAQEVITLDELERRLSEKGHTTTDLGAYEARVDGKPTYIRPGSSKPKGWQVTLRNAFRESVRDQDGYLIVNRGRGLLIPSEALTSFLGDALDQKTVDIFVTFESERVAKIAFKKRELDVSRFLL